MKRFLLLIITLGVILWNLSLPSVAYAVTNPLEKPNNKVGIHILFVDELEEAGKLVNSSGGDWGYVTIPIQSGDRNLDKWQGFMDTAKKLHLIPLIRLATEGDYFNTKVWRKPNELDVVDFANFLNSLSWPTKNRYVIVFNEVNRGDEWGGQPSASEYANLLSFTVSVFKSKTPDFFVISSGFDNASANIINSSVNEYTFIQQMNTAVPGIYNQVDGIASHSYPNPAFSKPPSQLDAMSIATYRHELSFLQSLGTKKLPVFITETGWPRNAIADTTASDYFTTAFESVWSDEDVVAVTPFLLRAHAGPFEPFSFLTTDNNKTEVYKKLESLSKIKGQPELSQATASGKTPGVLGVNTPTKDFSETAVEEQSPYVTEAGLVEVPPNVKFLFKWLLRIEE